jgi:hypothetical protein
MEKATGTFVAAAAASLLASVVTAERAPLHPGQQNLSHRSAQAPGVGRADGFAVSRPLSAIAPLASTGSAAPRVPTPILNFDGLSSQDIQDAYGYRTKPSVNGDVGPNHYVQAAYGERDIFNRAALARVFSKSGTPLTAPFKIASLFAPLPGEGCHDAHGDPTILYDQLADRWVIAVYESFFDIEFPRGWECIAVSTTADPTGAYFLYRFNSYDFSGDPRYVFDSTRLGVWPDAYYMGYRLRFGIPPADARDGVAAFDRAKMLAGAPNPGLVRFPSAIEPATIPFGLLPADLDGMTPPPPGTPNFVATLGTNVIRIFNFHVDFGNAFLSSFTESAMSVAPFDTRSPTGANDIEQPAPAPANAYLDSGQDRLNHRLAYRNSGSHQSLVVTHTVNVGPDPTTPSGHQSAIRYYEFRFATPGAFAVVEQATFAPDAENRWMGSAAMDRQGNIAVGYNVSSANVFPSIRYAARMASDPANGLYQGETTLMAGSGVQLDTSGAWGRFSALAVDPADDCTFWYTALYYTAASQASSPLGWLTRIGTFRLPGCAGEPQGTLSGRVTSAATGAPIINARVTIDPGGSPTSTDGSGFYTQALPPGPYTLTVSAPQYQTASASGIVVTDGATTTRDVALTPVTRTLTGVVRDATTHTPINNAIVTIDPGGFAVHTDTSGSYTASVPPGTYTLTAVALHYVRHTFTGVATTGATTTVDFALSQVSVTGDFDHDATSDVTVYRPSTGGWHVLKSSTSHSSSLSFSWGMTGDVPVPGDYDGDGTIDPAIFRPSTGLWAILNSSTNYTTSSYATWGSSTDVPAPGDYDGDGRMDPAIWRPSTGLWAILLSSTNYTTSSYATWGLSTDLPLQADYDGDGKTDPAIFRPSTGLWAILNSRANYTTSMYATWGLSTDVPVPGDYDGDGKVDPAIWRPSTGLWAILSSNTSYTTSMYATWGLSTDVPVPGDYDGDGRADPVIWRPSTGLWAILHSRSDYTTSSYATWGLSTDTPINKRPQ